MTAPYDPNQAYGNPQYGQPNPYAQPPQYAPAPPQQFAPPQYAPQGYPQQYAPQGQPQLAAGSLDSYFSQPSTGGGAALKFEVGTTHVGIVSRQVTNADVQQQTQPQTGIPQTYKDGRPKFVMKVPLTVQQSQAHPEGQAQWYCAGGARDELMRAMAEAGAPEGPPEKGAVIQISCTGTRPSGAGFNPAKVYQVVYRRPEGAAPVQQAPAQGVDFAKLAQQAPVPSNGGPGSPGVQSYLPEGQVPQPQATTPPVGPQQPQPSAVPPVNIPPAAGLDEKQQALLAQLTGQASQQ
jgi:hypothetical protein